MSDTEFVNEVWYRCRSRHPTFSGAELDRLHQLADQACPRHKNKEYACSPSFIDPLVKIAKRRLKEKEKDMGTRHCSICKENPCVCAIVKEELRRQELARLAPLIQAGVGVDTPHTPIEVAVAMSLYAYNVSSGERARKLYDHFDGNCAEFHDLANILTHTPAYAATELAMPTASVYVDHALERYGEEARERVRVNMGGWHD